MLHEFTYEVSDIVKLIEAESKMMAARGWREGEMGVAIQNV